MSEIALQSHRIAPYQTIYRPADVTNSSQAAYSTSLIDTFVRGEGPDDAFLIQMRKLGNAARNKNTMVQASAMSAVAQSNNRASSQTLEQKIRSKAQNAWTKVLKAVNGITEIAKALGGEKAKLLNTLVSGLRTVGDAILAFASGSLKNASQALVRAAGILKPLVEKIGLKGVLKTGITALASEGITTMVSAGWNTADGYWYWGKAKAEALRGRQPQADLNTAASVMSYASAAIVALQPLVAASAPFTAGGTGTVYALMKGISTLLTGGAEVAVAVAD